MVSTPADGDGTGVSAAGDSDVGVNDCCATGLGWPGDRRRKQDRQGHDRQDDDGGSGGNQAEQLRQH